MIPAAVRDQGVRPEVAVHDAGGMQNTKALAYRRDNERTDLLTGKPVSRSQRFRKRRHVIIRPHGIRMALSLPEAAQWSHQRTFNALKNFYRPGIRGIPVPETAEQKGSAGAVSGSGAEIGVYQCSP